MLARFKVQFECLQADLQEQLSFLKSVGVDESAAKFVKQLRFDDRKIFKH